MNERNVQMKAFNILDSKAEAWTKPIFETNTAMAIRYIQSRLTNEPGLRQFAADYTLCECGTYNPETGSGTYWDQPKPLMNISELIDDDETSNDSASERI